AQKAPFLPNASAVPARRPGPPAPALVAAGASISGPQRAAILLLALGEDTAADIFKNLGEKEIQALGLAVSKVGELAPSHIDATLAAFLHDASSTALASG